MEAPHLSRVAEKFRDKGLVVLSVNAWNEDRDTLQRFVTEKNLKQRILLNGSTTYRAYGLDSIPVSLWIDRAGIIRDVEVGFGGAAELERATKRLLERD